MNSTCKKKCPYCKKKKKERSKRIQTKNYWHHALHKKKLTMTYAYDNTTECKNQNMTNPFICTINMKLTYT